MNHIDIPVVIVPGLGGSAHDHWQSHWARKFGACRVEQADWERPELSTWIDSLLKTVEQSPDSLLVAHSLGCILITHAAKRLPDLAVRGAFLVAPADIDKSPAVPAHLSSFANIPLQPLPFPSVTVISDNDPYVSPERARALASAWQSQLIDVGAYGHINVASGFGAWPEGEELLLTFSRTLKRSATGARRIA